MKTLDKKKNPSVECGNSSLRAGENLKVAPRRDVVAVWRIAINDSISIQEDEPYGAEIARHSFCGSGHPY